MADTKTIKLKQQNKSINTSCIVHRVPPTTPPHAPRGKNTPKNKNTNKKQKQQQQNQQHHNDNKNKQVMVWGFKTKSEPLLVRKENCIYIHVMCQYTLYTYI